MIKNAIKEAKRKANREAWERIFSVKPDPELAEEIEKRVKEFRKNFRLREYKELKTKI